MMHLQIFVVPNGCDPEVQVSCFSIILCDGGHVLYASVVIILVPAWQMSWCGVPEAQFHLQTVGGCIHTMSTDFHLGLSNAVKVKQILCLKFIVILTEEDAVVSSLLTLFRTKSKVVIYKRTINLYMCVSMNEDKVKSS